MSRIPRWGWWAIAIGILVPIVLVLAAVLTVALLSGLLVLAVVLVILGVRTLVGRLRSRDDGRRNVRIIRDANHWSNV